MYDVIKAFVLGLPTQHTLLQTISSCSHMLTEFDSANHSHNQFENIRFVELLQRINLWVNKQLINYALNVLSCYFLCGSSS